MSNTQQGTAQKSTATRSAPRPAGRRYFPGVKQIAGVVLCGTGVVVAQWLTSATNNGVGFLDGAIANILTLIFSFFAFMTLLVWFCLWSDYPRIARRGLPVLIVVAIAAIAATHRVDSTTGNLFPTFRPRWAKRIDENLEKARPKTSDQSVNLTTLSADDFPQFLGLHRHPSLPDSKVGEHWPPKLLWKQPIGAGWSAFSVVNGYAVTMEQRGPEELVTCYDARTGELKWANAIEARHETTLGGIGPRSTPSIYEGKVYALGATGILRCLEGATGSELWRQELFKMVDTTQDKDGTVVAWGRANSPLVFDNLVVVPVGGPPGGPFISLAAFNKDTGEKIWTGGKTQISYASPALETLAGVRQIVIVNESNVAGHDPLTGKVLWQHEWPGASAANANNSQAAYVEGDRLLLSKGYGAGAALIQISRDANGEWKTAEIWHKTSLLKTKFTNIVVHAGHAYALSEGILECVEIATGRSCWKRGRYNHGQLLGVGNKLIVLSETGELVLVPASPERPEELGTFSALNGKTWNNLCLAGKLLLVRNGEEAACFEFQ